VFDPLIDGQDRQIAGSPKSPVVEQRLEISEHAVVPVGMVPDPLYEIRAGCVKLLPGYGFAFMLQKSGSVFFLTTCTVIIYSQNGRLGKGL
jgi:hypothetical protein